VTVIEKLLLKIRHRYRFSEEQARALRAAIVDTQTFGADQIIVPEHEPVSFSSLLVEGLACRSKYLAEGERQIMEIDVPGDFVDLHSYPLEWLDHSVTALTPCTIAKVPHEKITALIVDDPRISRILWFATMVDASIHREWLVSIARRSALERIAHLFCEMYYRLKVVELTDGLSYDFALTQIEVGEALGMTPVHVNRMLRELKEKGLVTFRGKGVTIHDLAALERTAGFDPSYLFLESRSG
jgi:CRP-like cAMP-binding protein